MSRLQVYAAFLLFLFLAGGATGQVTDFRIKHLSLDQGLSQSQVVCIIQDSVGFIWFGTRDGLNRYDGYRFVQYKFDPSRGNSLSHNRVDALMLDSSGELWVGTYDGLNRYAASDGTFTRFMSDPQDPTSLSNNMVQVLIEADPGRIWVGTNKGLNLLDIATGTAQRWFAESDNDQALSSDTIQALALTKDKRLWVGTQDGLFFMEHDHSGFTRTTLSDEESFKDKYINCLLLTKDGDLWVGTPAGLNQYNGSEGKLKRSWKEGGDPFKAGVRNLFEDSRGDLWVVSFRNGLFRISGESVLEFHHDPFDANTISSDDVLSVYEDRSRVIWAGLNVRGLSALDPFAAKFSYLRPKNKAPTQPSNNNVSAILEDRQQRLWMSSWQDGLTCLNRQTGERVHYQHDKNIPSSLNNGMTTALLEDGEGNLWVGSSGGLSRFDESQGNFIHFTHSKNDANSIGPGMVFDLYLDRQDRFWVGMIGVGLYQFFPHEDRFVHYAINTGDPMNINFKMVRIIFEDSQNQLWIGTLGGGLNLFDVEQGRFKHFLYNAKDPQSISHNFVLSLVESDQGDGKLWVGTRGGGLNLFDPKKSVFIRYTEQNSDLPSNVVYGILIDESSNLWLSTNRGISCFEVGTGQFTNYDVDDGLQSKEFNQGAYFKSSQGEMMFGGINGINTFFPRQIRINPFPPEVALIDIRLMGVSMGASLDNDTLKLSHHQNDLNFEFVGLHFSRPEENLYSHILENYDQAWRPPGYLRTATYTNLDPGNYTFRVKTANNDAVWNNRDLTVKVMISPPWWQTWFAYTVYVLLLAGCLALINRLQARHLIKIEREKAQMKESHLRAEAAELKTRAMAAHAKALQAENKRKELEHAALDAENTRKNLEFAQARQLQLSMLPKDVPHHDHMEIAAYMETATEVGGDYYDFTSDAQGVLTAVIGDATGHGLQAGTVVAATKSLFNALARDTEPVQLLRKMSSSLKAMGFHNMYMGLTIAKFEGAHLQLVSAGMPFPMLYRAKSHDLELVEVRGMPLGSFPEFPYTATEIILCPGDILVLMSDGLQERFNPRNEMLGVSRTRQIFAAVTPATPGEVITHMIKEGKIWSEGRPLDDDVTFVVFKYLGNGST